MRSGAVNKFTAARIAIIFGSFFILAALFTSESVSASDDGCLVGAFIATNSPDQFSILDFNNLVQRDMHMIMWYQDFSCSFPTSSCQDISASGAIPHITWEPWLNWGAQNIYLDDILGGTYDSYIRGWAVGAKSFGEKLFIRWGHEFNGNWYPWGLANNGAGTKTGYGDPTKYDGAERFVNAYRRIHGIFEAEGATNVEWIWAYNVYSVPNEPWNAPELAYPGDGYVDWIGIDGYNWGTTQTWSSWQSFNEVFAQAVNLASTRWPSKPIMIAEFASAEEGGDKAAWIDAIPSVLEGWPQVRAITWFHIYKECDWRVNSSQSALEAFRRMIKNPIFLEAAQFSLSNLRIQPSEVEAGHPVSIKVDVSNRGGAKGTQKVWLKLDGSAVDSQEIQLEGGRTTTIEFIIGIEDPGIHSIEVDGISQDLSVTEKISVGEEGLKIEVLVLIGCGIYIGGGLLYFFISRSKE